jgi:hypothetical protein
MATRLCQHIAAISLDEEREFLANKGHELDSKTVYWQLERLDCELIWGVTAFTGDSIRLSQHHRRKVGFHYLMGSQASLSCQLTEYD